ncbi:MAG: outer membrane protein assembly factor BamD [Candidatus Zixiibacteriota bacterium]
MSKLQKTSFAAFLLFVIVLSIVGCGGKKTMTLGSATQLFKSGMEFYDQKKYARAVEAFQMIVYNYPGESIVDTAQYYLALSYFGNEEYALAQVEFNRLIVNYPSSAYIVNAQFLKAVCFFEGTPKHYGLDQTDLEQAIKLFEDFIIDHPESELMPDAQKYLLLAQTRMARKYYESGVVYVRLNAPTAAKKYFQIVIDDYTNTEYAPRATYYKAESEMKLGNYDDAIRQFDNFVAVFSEHEWRDKALEKRQEAFFMSAEKAFTDSNYTKTIDILDDYLSEYQMVDEITLKKAAFLSAEASFMNKDYAIARDKFQSYIDDYDRNKRTRKAEKYLEEINEILSRQTVNYGPSES